jgi:DNA-binding CsgD family transcriptional regulator
MLDQLQHGRDSYEQRAWAGAYHALRLADEASPLDTEDLERLATSAYLSGRDSEYQRCLDRLHRMYVEADDRRRAARCAFWLGLSLLLRGDVGQSNAWIARGKRLVEGRDCVEQAYLLVPGVEQLLRGGKTDAAHSAATEVAALADAHDDADLSAAARHGLGRALIQQGHVAAGLDCLDETMLAVVAGELSPIMTGLLYCSVLEACREVQALGRAREWTVAFSRWCDEQCEMIAFAGTCLVHRAEIMQFRGAWLDAMEEACRACERAERADRKPPGAALYRQGEIHRLRGEFALAEEAYLAANRLGCEPQPGLALLRMAQGRTDAARAAIDRVVCATADPGRRAQLLPAFLEIVLAAGDVPAARRACDEVHALAETFDADVLGAVAAQAHGAIELADGDPRAALAPLRCAFDAWQRLEAPYHAAGVRVLVGLACRALGDREASDLEFDAARATFEQLGARADVARLDATANVAMPRQTGRLTDRELHVLRLVSVGKTNKAIATALRLSERTIDRHVSNILTKLDVPSRAAATAYAYDHKLF